MHKVNFRFVLAGVILIALAMGFALHMQSVASKSTNPAELMRIVGGVAGGAGGLGVVIVILGLLGKGFRKRD